jgi:translation initiation factor 4E
MDIQEVNPLTSHHTLNNKWCVWAHLPHDTDWSVASYKKIYTITSVEEAIVLFETIPDIMVQNCMLFIMKQGINPLWEDSHNRNGGSFSYKINNKIVATNWKFLAYSLFGENLMINSNNNNFINGITISPKKNFCIFKIWMIDCNHQNPNIFNEVKDINHHGCLFKKHIAEY